MPTSLISNLQPFTSARRIITDSRYITSAQDSIFFAIRGKHHDGHQFIQELYGKGVREFVVEIGATFPFGEEQITVGNGQLLTAFQSDFLPLDCKFWTVNNAIQSLQEMARLHRQQFDLPVIGITGSNGKTIVKEWLAYLLAATEQVVKSPRSYNSQIGVALSLWQLQQKDTVGIFEAGVSQTGEMKALAQMIAPTIGIFTTIGSAHDEGFKSKRQKITEKLRLFGHSKTLIYCADQTDVEKEIRLMLPSINPSVQLLGWSFAAASALPVQQISTDTSTHLTIRLQEQDYAFTIPFIDRASIENAVHCALACLVLNTPWQQIRPRFEQLKPVAMRLEMKQGVHNTYIIDDTYNNDLVGLEMALNFLNQQQTHRDKVLILSDIAQSGMPEEKLYEEVKKLLLARGVKIFIGVGEGLYKHRPMEGHYFRTTEELLHALPQLALANAIILVKGARVFAFERIVQRLVKRVHGTVLEINLDAVTHNLNFYRSKLRPPTRLMVMVKAHAYGSGSTEVASLLQYHRVDYLGVAYPDEGVMLRENGIQLPIMVLNSSPETYATLVAYRLEPEVYSLDMIAELAETVQHAQLSEPFRIHIKLDTGMHRLGFEEKDIPALISLLQQHPHLQVASIFSHLVGADEAVHNPFSLHQIATFKRLSDKLTAALPYQVLRHICNSAGILRFPEAHFDMVRLGVGLYGVEATNEEQAALRVVGTLKTTISQIKMLPKGETVGYSRKGELMKDSRIATIAIGYADGFDRGFSKGVGQVNVHGVLCPVVGNVCMDMTMIDVTDVPCEVGDEVIIFGENPTLNQLAATIDTIPYEILSTISDRVKRVFYKE